jgi:hypothetical protein
VKREDGVGGVGVKLLFVNRNMAQGFSPDIQSQSDVRQTRQQIADRRLQSVDNSQQTINNRHQKTRTESYCCVLLSFVSFCARWWVGGGKGADDTTPSSASRSSK